MTDIKKLAKCLVVFLSIFNSGEGIKVLRNTLSLEDKGVIGGATIANPEIFDNDFDAVTVCIRFNVKILMAVEYTGLARILSIG